MLTGEGRGALIIVGSHVRKTTEQLACLREGNQQAAYLACDVTSALRPGALKEETHRVMHEAEALLHQNRTVVVYTSRRLLTVDAADTEAALRVSVAISAALTGVVSGLKTRPRYVLAKGGITSSDVAVLGLGMRRALVLGQALQGVPVWRTGAESLFPGLPYIVFPGNVGEADSLLQLVHQLEPKSKG
jgi:uncharacterized protein YgbK (DUF1537 family)